MAYNFTKKIKTKDFEILIDDAAEYGYFEHEDHGDECGGGLWFKSKELMDADGTSILPKEVATALREAGYIVSEDFD